VVGLDATLGQQLLDVPVGEPKRRYQRTATTITSGGNRKRVNTDCGGIDGQER